MLTDGRTEKRTPTCISHPATSWCDKNHEILCFKKCQKKKKIFDNLLFVIKSLYKSEHLRATFVKLSLYEHDERQVDLSKNRC